MKGLDLSKFKKIKEDKSHAVLRHMDGHEMKIAIMALSPKMREQLSKLPMHKAEGGAISPSYANSSNQSAALKENYSGKKKIKRFADGGDTTPEDPTAGSDFSSEDTSAPANSADYPKPPTDQPASADNTIDVVGQTPSAPTDVSGSALPPADVPAPPSQGAVIPPDPNLANQMNAEDANIKQDMMNGHIQPQTMASLFANKSTLGKIGTVFGMMIGGAGAGLSHQPNLLAQMMQDQINNDLKAQQDSNVNSQNWLRLHQANQLNEMQIPLMAAQRDLIAAQASKIPSEIAQAQANVNAIQAEANVRSTVAAKNSMLNSALQHSLGISNGLPNGTAKVNANGIINNTLTPAVDATIQKNNNDAANQINGIRASVQPPPDINAAKLQQEIQTGALMSANGMPGVAGVLPSDVPAVNAESTQVGQTRAMAKMYDNAFTNLNTPYAGQAGSKMADAVKILGPATVGLVLGLAAKGNPSGAALASILGDHATDPAFQSAAQMILKYQQYRAAQVGTLGPMIARATAGRYNSDEASAQADALFPTVYDSSDNEKTRKAKYDNSMAWIKSQEQTPTLDRYPGIKSSFPNYQYKAMTKEDKEPPVFMGLSVP